MCYWNFIFTTFRTDRSVPVPLIHIKEGTGVRGQDLKVLVFTAVLTLVIAPLVPGFGIWCISAVLSVRRGLWVG